MSSNGFDLRTRSGAELIEFGWEGTLSDLIGTTFEISAVRGALASNSSGLFPSDVPSMPPSRNLNDAEEATATLLSPEPGVSGLKSPSDPIGVLSSPNGSGE